MDFSRKLKNFLKTNKNLNENFIKNQYLIENF